MKKTKRYKINGKRMIRNILFLLVVFILFNILTSQIFGKKDIKTKSVVIKQGDTLWGISSSICNEDSSLNIQEVIYDIKQINNLKTNNIVNGETLQIPIYF